MISLPFHERRPDDFDAALREVRRLLALTSSTWILALLATPLLVLCLLLTPPGLGAAPAHAATTSGGTDPAAAALPRAVAEMEQLDQLRVSLASLLEGRSEEPTLETMKEVCRPVGMRAAAIARENGWSVRQVATKYRNPDHAPADGRERQVIDLFARHPGIGGLWEPAASGEPAGVHYYRRIDVQPSCLACHGSRASRPAFVKEGYPEDRAFDFRPADLRGMYAVFIPEVQEALREAA